MTYAICIPFRSEDPHRLLSLRRVLQHYGPLVADGVTVNVGANDGPFTRSAARNAVVNETLARQPGVTAVAVIDADCVIATERLLGAIRTAEDTGMAVLPHDRFLPLSPTGTQAALVEPDFRRWKLTWVIPPIRDRKRPSGVIVFPVNVWHTVGGYDERFTGWGYEDSSMLLALHAAGGWHRGSGDLWHLWHPEGERSVVNQDDKRLFNRYRDAVDDPVKLQALIAEHAGSTLRT